MTMLDDNTVASLLTRAGEAFEVPATGEADIVARALGPARISEPADDDVDGPNGAGPDELDRGARPTVLHRVTGAALRHRGLSVAASILLVVVLVGTVGRWPRSSSSGPAQSGPSTSSSAGSLVLVGPSARATMSAAPVAGTSNASPARVRREATVLSSSMVIG